MNSAQDGRFTDDHRRALRALEKLRKPTEWDRGLLSALRQFAIRPADVQRVQDLTEKWRATR